MILNLSTKNFALISDLSLAFHGGLTVITGETGSGKSLLVNSLGLLAGKKGETGWIRAGCEDALVEGVFEVDSREPVRSVLEGAGIPFETPLVVRRVLHREGKNRVFINDCASTLATLRSLAPYLMEIQSQRDHHSFLHPSRHVHILDAYGGLEGSHSRYHALYLERNRLVAELQQSEQSSSERTQRMDFLRFQIDELESASLVPGEEETLRKEYQVLSKATRCKEDLNTAAHLLTENEPSARELLAAALSHLQEWKDLKHEIATAVEALENAMLVVEDQSLSLLSIAEGLSEDPEELQRIAERLDLIARFKPKYGSSVEEMLEYLGRVKGELAGLEGCQENSELLRQRLEQVEKDLWQAGEHLNQRRREVVTGFCGKVEGELKRLRLEGARFHVRFSGEELGPQGIGKVEFFIEPNPGEGVKPLWKVASGGELSRITLAIHSILSHRGDCDLWVLDEIDTGIGGETAVEVGRLLKSIARERQILCITHLPQIAAFGEQHLRVTKRIEGERTLTSVEHLDREESREELKRMVGGEAVPFLGERDDCDR